MQYRIGMALIAKMPDVMSESLRRQSAHLRCCGCPSVGADDLGLSFAALDLVAGPPGSQGR